MSARPSNVTVSAAALVIANLVPLFGVLFLGWSTGIVLFIYWLETVIVGFYHVPRLILATKPGWRNYLETATMLPFFALQFTMTVFVQGLIVVVLFNPGAEGMAELAAAPGSDAQPTPQEEWAAYFGLVDGEELALEQLPLVLLYTLIISGSYWALLGLFISHGVSFAVNFVKGGEYRRVTPGDIAAEPYKRVTLMQIAVMTGAVFWLILGQPFFVLLMLVVLKIALDLTAHHQERLRMMPGHGNSPGTIAHTRKQ